MKRIKHDPIKFKVGDWVYNERYEEVNHVKEIIIGSIPAHDVVEFQFEYHNGLSSSGLYFCQTSGDYRLATKDEIRIGELKECIEKNKKGSELILDNINEQLYKKAPTIIHNRFCSELLELAKTKPSVIPKDDPEMSKVMEHIEFLENIYPKLKGL